MGSIRERRDELIKDMEMATDPTVHQFLIDVAFEEATKRVSGNYHPAVRFNAMLIVGDLNQTESRISGTERYPAVRLAKAFDFMVDELKRADQLDVVRIAALLGIQRHLRLVRQRPQDQPIPDARKVEVTALVKPVVDQKTPPDGRNLVGHTWLRRGAVDVLATVGMVGDGRAVFNSLVTIAGDAEEPLSLRCTAARSLAELNYTDVTGIDALTTARQLGALAAYACRLEDERVKEEEKKHGDTAKRPAGSGYPGMGGLPGSGGYPGLGSGGTYPGSGGTYPGSGGTYPGMGGGPGYPGSGPLSGAAKDSEEPDERIDAVRRRLKLPLLCVLLGLRGEAEKSGPPSTDGQTVTLASIGGLAVDEQQKSEITKIVGAVEAIVAASDQLDDGLEGMMEQVRSKTRDLENLLPNVTKVEEEPAVEDELPGGALPGAAPAKKGSAPAKKGAAPKNG